MVDRSTPGIHNVTDRTQPSQALRDLSTALRKLRSAQGASGVDDEQAVEEMLSYFPARDVEEPVTKDFLRAELHSEVGAVNVKIGELRAEMIERARSTQTWIVSTGISLAGLMLAIARFG